MKKDIVLHVDGIKKCFKIYSSPSGVIREWLSLGKRSYHEDFWALKGVSFDVRKGEFTGIIGPNGAGKSTLLKIITGVLTPSEGFYQMQGRALSILELSSGQDKDLSGRENVIRSGQMLGFPDGYVKERMDVIKEFSELGFFFEQPIRLYSSGMRTRLSFSMFAFLKTDILILDEVLAVGDIFFKQKCFSRLQELIDQKTSIILVTHSMGVIQRYCKRVVVLNKGNMVFNGPPEKAIQLYSQLRWADKRENINSIWLTEDAESLDSALPIKKGKFRNSLDIWPSDSLFTYRNIIQYDGRENAILTRFTFLNGNGENTLTFKNGEELHIFCEFILKRDMEVPVFQVEIKDKYNLVIHTKNSFQNNLEPPTYIPAGKVIRYYQSVILGISPGKYVLNLRCDSMRQVDFQKIERLGFKKSNRRLTLVWDLNQAISFRVVSRIGEKMELVHGGLCDLPGKSQVGILANRVAPDLSLESGKKVAIKKRFSKNQNRRKLD